MRYWSLAPNAAIDRITDTAAIVDTHTIFTPTSVTATINDINIAAASTVVTAVTTYIYTSATSVPTVRRRR